MAGLPPPQVPYQVATADLEVEVEEVIQLLILVDLELLDKETMADQENQVEVEEEVLEQLVEIPLVVFLHIVAVQEMAVQERLYPFLVHH